MKSQQHTFLGKLARLLLLASLVVATAAAQAQTAIEAVTGSLQGGAEVVKIDLSEVLPALPNGFSIQSPARIALDFPGVVSAMGRSNVDINQGNLRSVSVVQAGDRTRVVLNLKQYTAYKTQLRGKSLYVLLEAVANTAAAAAPTVFAENLNRDAMPLRDIDFRRGEDASGRIVVSLPNDQVGVDIRQQGQTLVVELLKTTLPEGLRRRLDVADFGTPVKMITTTQIGDRVRVVIEPQGQWTHSAYQSNSQFVVEVKAVKVDPTKLTQGPGYTGQKLSLNFQNIEVRSLLQVIADFTGNNIITSDAVNGSLTLRLQEVPWDQALDIILQTKGLDKRKTNNVIWIAPKEEMIAKDKQELEAKVMALNLEPVITQAFQLNYAEAQEVAKQLTGSGGGDQSVGRTLSTRGSATADQRTNQIFVTDVATRLEQVLLVLKTLDVPRRQVMIEARIVEANEDFGKSLGIKFGATDLRAKQGGDGGYKIAGDNRVSIGGTYLDAINASGANGSSINTSSTFVNLPASGLGFGDPATFALSIFSSVANRFLNLEISALEADSKGRVVSSPRLVTADGKKSKITQGEEIPYRTCTDDKGSISCTTSFKPIGLILDVTPRITPDGTIIMDLDVSKDNRGADTPNGPLVNRKNVTTQVVVDNGGTIVIGGIFELTETSDETKVPWFGDLPGVGNLFRNNAKIHNKRELLVFVTPRIVSDLELR